MAAAAGTTIFTVGAKPGEPYAPPAWEVNAEAFPYFDEGEYGRAKEVLERALGERGENAGLLYNLACAESRLGETDRALEHLLRAVVLDAQYAGFAQEDADFEAIRRDERFPRRTRDLGQQKGSKRSKSSLRNPAQIRCQKPAEPHQ